MVVQHRRDGEPFLLCIDSNVRVGSVVTSFVGGQELGEESKNDELLRAFLARTGTALPATFRGGGGTWQDRAERWHRLDHAGVSSDALTAVSCVEVHQEGTLAVQERRSPIGQCLAAVARVSMGACSEVALSCQQQCFSRTKPARSTLLFLSWSWVLFSPRECGIRSLMRWASQASRGSTWKSCRGPKTPPTSGRMWRRAGAGSRASGSRKQVHTFVGTRPGDPLADVVFALTFLAFQASLEHILNKVGASVQVPRRCGGIFGTEESGDTPLRHVHGRPGVPAGGRFASGVAREAGYGHGGHGPHCVGILAFSSIWHLARRKQRGE